MIPSENTKRLTEARKEAESAFWSVIVEHFPEADDGDFLMNTDVMDEWIQHWVESNADPIEEEDEPMTDKIAYLVTESGMDGMGKMNITFASFDETARDAWYDAKGNNKCYYSKSKRIIEVEKEHKQAMAKLDGVQRLLLDIDQRPSTK